jgi:hypothetical protein
LISYHDFIIICNNNIFWQKGSTMKKTILLVSPVVNFTALLSMLMLVIAPYARASMPDWVLRQRSDAVARKEANDAAEEKTKQMIFDQQAMILDTALRSGNKSGIQAISNRFNVGHDTASMLFSGAMQYFTKEGKEQEHHSDKMRAAELAIGTGATVAALVGAIATGGSTALAFGAGKVSTGAAVAAGTTTLTAVLAFAFKAASLTEEWVALKQKRKVRPGAEVLNSYSDGLALATTTTSYSTSGLPQTKVEIVNDVIGTSYNQHFKKALERGYSYFRWKNKNPRVPASPETLKPYPESRTFTDEYLNCLKNTQYTVPADGTVIRTDILQDGTKYEIIASGIFQYDEGEEGTKADAQHYEDDNHKWQRRNFLAINGSTTDAAYPKNSKNSKQDKYCYYITGQGKAITLRISDDGYDDNKGNISVQIKEIY